MHRLARIIGYSLTLLLLAGVLGLLWFFNQDEIHKPYTVRIAFANIGTLMEDDPVKMRGVAVGKVLDIERKDEAAIVTLEMFKRLPIARNSSFINYNYSLFGARMVLLIPGTDSEPLDRTQIQEGYFIGGVAEAIHKVGELLRYVTRIQGQVQLFQKGDGQSPSLQGLLENKIYPMAQAYSQLNQDLQAFEKSSKQQVNVLQKEMSNLHKQTKIWHRQNDTLMQQAQMAIAHMDTFADQNIRLMQSVEKLTAAMSDTTQGLSKALLQKQVYEDLILFDSNLQSLLKLLRRQGLQDAIHFWRNVRILGKNPTHTTQP